jgi:branched-chain amino acid transport system substrate-binding protein
MIWSRLMVPGGRMAGLALLTGLACRDGAPGVIGDAYTRERGRPSMADVIEVALDSLPGQPPIRITRWEPQPGDDIERLPAQAAAFAATPGLVGVVGHAGSRDALVATSVYNARRIPHIVPNATSRRLAAAGPWTFTLVPNDSIEGEFLARFAVDSMHARRVSIWYVGDEYGVGLRDGVAAGLRLRGQQPVDQVVIPNEACTGEQGEGVKAIVGAALRRASTDLVVLAIGTVNAGCVVRAAHDRQPGLRMLGADGVAPNLELLGNLTNDEAESLRSVVFWTPGDDEASRRFVARARRILGREPTSVDALVYDGYMLLATATRQVGTDRLAIRGWLRSLGRGIPPYMGVTGPITFDAPRVEILRLQSVRAAPTSP